LAPTLNFNHNKGLRYEISFDGGTPQIVNFNGHYRGELGRWQSEHIIKSATKHQILQPENIRCDSEFLSRESFWKKY
jgi:hypothetical protein